MEFNWRAVYFGRICPPIEIEKKYGKWMFYDFEKVGKKLVFTRSNLCRRFSGVQQVPQDLRGRGNMKFSWYIFYIHYEICSKYITGREFVAKIPL